MLRYKAGNKVRIKSDITPGRYGGVAFIRDMMQFRGNVYTVSQVSGNQLIMKEIPFTWTDEMVEPVVIKKYSDSFDTLSKSSSDFLEMIGDI